MFVELLEGRALLSGQSLLFAGIDDSAASPTNAGLILAADLATGRQMPLDAQVPFTGKGVSGMAFLSTGELFGSTSAGPGSTSDLVRIDPRTGEEISRVSITAAASPISIADLAVQPASHVIYAVRSADDGGGGAGEIYTLDAGSGAAAFVGRVNTSAAVDGGLAFAPDGTLYYTTTSTLAAPVLHTLDPASAAVLSTVFLTGSQGANSGLAYWPDGDTLVASGAPAGQIVSINAATGARADVLLEAPARGIMGDLDFAPHAPQLKQIHHADFENGRDEYTADNSGGTFPGLWHYSLGRRDDGLVNHSLTHAWYYGAFEGPRGEGRYDVFPGDHQGVLISPVIQLPEGGATILSFSYVLGTRAELDRDFVDVSIDDGATITQILSRQDGTLPQTGREKWLTSTADISSFNGRQVSIRFRFETGVVPKVDPEGWYVDDVQISNFAALGSIHGFKFNDVDGNGSFEPGEPLLPGATFTLTEKSDANSNNQIDTFDATTGADGKFEFTGLHPGDYTLEETVFPAGAVAGSSFVLDVTVAGGVELVAILGSVDLNPDEFETLLPELAVANTLYGSLHGFKFNDVNGNGTLDPGEPVLPGAIFTLAEKSDVNGNNQIDSFDATTGADGRFEFADIYPGDYTLDERVFPQGAVAGSAFSLEVTIASGEELVAVVATADLLPGQFETLLPELAVANTLYGSLHGFKFNDVDGNGTLDPGEPVLPGAIFTLAEKSDVNGNNQIDTFDATTGADGKFEFSDVYPGDYTLEERVFPQGAVAGSAFSLDVTIASGEELVAVVGSADLLPGQFETLLPELAVANTLYGSLHGFKFNDVNDNGTFDPGEPVLPGVIFTLAEKSDVNGNNQIDAFDATTGADGKFEFTDIYPGDYTLEERVFPQGAVAGSAFSLEVTIKSGEELVAVVESADLLPGQFETLLPELAVANTLYGSLHGFKFNDVDASGTFDPGEPLLAGVTITLSENSDVNDNGQLDTFEVVTGPDGAYEFTEVHPGQYTLDEILPSGFTPSESLPMDVTIRSGEELVSTLGIANLNPGQFETLLPELAIANRVIETQAQTVQFITPMSVFRLAGPFTTGDNKPPEGNAAITGYKWHDVNQNGIWDAAESGRPGWRIFIDASGDGILDPQTERFAITGTDGRYTLEGLAPGTYTVLEDRAGLSDSTFNVQTFPAADAIGRHAHVITVAASETFEGGFGTAEAPNFGGFDYSPFVRPADDELGHLRVADPATRRALLAALSPWQKIALANPIDATIQITGIIKSFDQTIPVADQFVTVTDANLNPLTLPLALGPLATIDLFVFYDPVVRSDDTVLAQYPDWFDDPATPVNESATRPAHTFADGDQLEIVTDAGFSYQVFLVGGSTYDSDIVYTGSVNLADFKRLDDFLIANWPTIEGEPGSAFEPTSDINARFPNGAGGTLADGSWPLAGTPPREIGMGDFGPLNVEFSRARAPFLDLDTDNSSGVRGTGYAAGATATDAATGVRIADFDARFANQLTLNLISMEIRILSPPDGQNENFQFDTLNAQFPNMQITGSSQFVDNTRVLTLTGSATVEKYAAVLATVRYVNGAATITPGARHIEIVATGGTDFTVLSAARERIGNRAMATLTLGPAMAAAAPAIASAIPHSEPVVAAPRVAQTTPAAVASSDAPSLAAAPPLTAPDGTTSETASVGAASIVSPPRTIALAATSAPSSSAPMPAVVASPATVPAVHDPVAATPSNTTMPARIAPAHAASPRGVPGEVATAWWYLSDRLFAEAGDDDPVKSLAPLLVVAPEALGGMPSETPPEGSFTPGQLGARALDVGALDDEALEGLFAEIGADESAAAWL